MNRRQLISIFFIALLLYILFNVLFILSPFAGPISWGMIIAFTFYPVYEKLRKVSGQNPTLAAGALTTLLLLALTPIVIFTFLLAVRETIHLYDWLTEFIKNGNAERLYEKIRTLKIFQKIESLKLSPWESLGTQLNQWVLNSFGTLGNFVLQHVTLITKNVIQATLNFFLTFFIIFFLFRDGHRIYGFIYEITPLDDEHKKEIFGQLSETFSATLRGQLFTSLAQAVLLGLVFWILRLPLPVFFAALAFLASMIPIAGVATIWMPFVIFLFATQEYPRAVALLALGAIVVSGIDNVLKPLLIGHKTKLPYSLLFLSILGGLQVYGFMGIFLAPAILSLFFVLIRIYQHNFPGDSI